jgi:hypothetical protein
LCSFWAKSGEGGNDLGHVGGSGAILRNRSDRGGGKASHGGGSDSSSETHFDIKVGSGLLIVVEVVVGVL